MLYACLRHRFLTAGNLLATTGSDLSPLFTTHHSVIFNALWTSYLDYLVGAAARAWGRAVHSGLPRATEESMSEDFEAVGRFLIDHPDPPWLSVDLPSRYEPVSLFGGDDFTPALDLFEAKDPVTYLGAAAAILIAAEMTKNRVLPEEDSLPLGAFSSLYPYIMQRWGHEPDTYLPEIPVPDRFERLFRNWANQNIDFVGRSANYGPRRMPRLKLFVPPD
jgi:hypothetical protein